MTNVASNPDPRTTDPRTTDSRTVNPWAALSALCVGFFLIMMDTTIVTIAIPGMIEGLDADLNQITWVHSVYLLTYAVPLLVAGRLGDRFGRKPVFMAGMAVFTAASLWCGLSGSAEMLMAARAVQGVGAALMAPQTMAFVTTLFPPQRRGAALGVWGAVAGLATTAGPLLGGFLTGSAGWEWIFLVNVPIGLVGLAMAARLLPGGQPRNHRRFDLLGTLLSGLGLFAVVFGLQNGQHYAWGTVVGPLDVATVIAAGVVLLGVFLLWQRFNPREPLMPLSLFGRRHFATSAFAAAAIGFAVTGLYLPLTLFMQDVMELTPQEAGLLMVPIAVSSGLAGPLAGSLSDRVPGKWVVLGGFLVFAAGLGLIVLAMDAHAGVLPTAGALFLAGIGTGLAFAPMANVATGSLPVEVIGAGAGMYNAIRQVGCVIGAAAVGVLMQAQIVEFPDDLGRAAATTLLLPVAALLVGAAACLLMPSGGAQKEKAQTAPDPAQTAPDRNSRETSGNSLNSDLEKVG
ncbi:MFS transporter [Streptomyces bambusae]|uniref:DHA2 family efflux MFS transporter permease subunit n=1 Tax=Streptomyces bambusae TaxID=1550616 RepID=A0ABS6Z2A3_9ACTN|nr:MFS transporter [Streptomyces bambusae]MBW5481383.1 DHA2 family efflux MFS transporter permease subunit [Streptomyces bambusae]